MKICDQYSHLNALDMVQNKGIYEEIVSSLNQKDVIFEKGNPLFINKSISESFNSFGWGDDIRLKNSRLSISFLKSKVGLCVQLGNVARMYADILKLCYLYDEGIIDVGSISVPHKIESRILGQNYARYDRLIKEVELFQKIIKVPILIIGLSN